MYLSLTYSRLVTISMTNKGGGGCLNLVHALHEIDQLCLMNLKK